LGEEIFLGKRERKIILSGSSMNTNFNPFPQTAILAAVQNSSKYSRNNFALKGLTSFGLLTRLWTLFQLPAAS
jgi:hypothetical protein